MGILLVTTCKTCGIVCSAAYPLGCDPLVIGEIIQDAAKRDLVIAFQDSPVPIGQRCNCAWRPKT